MMKRLIVLLSCVLHLSASAQNILTDRETSAFPVVSSGAATTILFDGADDSLVQKAAQLFQKDVEMVSGKKLTLSLSIPALKNIIVIGSIQRSAFIQQLIKTKKLNVDKLK